MFQAQGVPYAVLSWMRTKRKTKQNRSATLQAQANNLKWLECKVILDEVLQTGLCVFLCFSSINGNRNTLKVDVKIYF